MLVQLITEQAAGVRICLNVITICLAALVAGHNATNKLVLEMIYGYAHEQHVPGGHETTAYCGRRGCRCVLIMTS